MSEDARSDGPEGEEGDLTMGQIGRKGGLICLANHGREHYRRIGRQGGRKVRDLTPRRDEGKKP